MKQTLLNKIEFYNRWKRTVLKMKKPMKSKIERKYEFNMFKKGDKVKIKNTITESISGIGQEMLDDMYDVTYVIKEVDYEEDEYGDYNIWLEDNEFNYCSSWLELA